MKRFLKKLFSIRISELIVLVVFIPSLWALSNNQNINLSVTILPPQDPQITTITVYPDLKALSISGEAIYNTQLMWLEDQEVGEAIELTIDTGGHYVAALDNSSQLTSVGTHKVIAWTTIEQDEVILLESNVLTYSIDEKFNVALDSISRDDVTLLTDSITEDEFKDLQDKYQLSVLSPSEYERLKYQRLYYEKMRPWFTVFRWIIYIIVLVFVPYLLISRWRRKKAQHKSFWSIGKGIYFQHGQPK